MKCQPIGEQWAGQDLPVSSKLQLEIILLSGLFVFQEKILFWSLKWCLYWLYKYNFWNIFILMHLYLYSFLVGMAGGGYGEIRIKRPRPYNIYDRICNVILHYIWHLVLSREWKTTSFWTLTLSSSAADKSINPISLHIVREEIISDK